MSTLSDTRAALDAIDRAMEALNTVPAGEMKPSVSALFELLEKEDARLWAQLRRLENE